MPVLGCTRHLRQPQQGYLLSILVLGILSPYFTRECGACLCIAYNV